MQKPAFKNSVWKLLNLVSKVSLCNGNYPLPISGGLTYKWDT